GPGTEVTRWWRGLDRPSPGPPLDRVGQPGSSLAKGGSDMNPDVLRYYADTMTPSEELVAVMQGFLCGSDDPIIDGITLGSPPNEWPPTIRIAYRVRGEHHVDEGGIVPFVDIGLASSLRAEADAQIGLFVAHVDEQEAARKR